LVFSIAFQQVDAAVTRWCMLINCVVTAFFNQIWDSDVFSIDAVVISSVFVVDHKIIL